MAGSFTQFWIYFHIICGMDLPLNGEQFISFWEQFPQNGVLHSFAFLFCEQSKIVEVVKVMLCLLHCSFL